MFLLRSLSIALALLVLAWPSLAAPSRSTVPLAAGENTYLRGVLSTGAPLSGERAGGAATEGQAAACINCHGRSGLGGSEGQALVPPITARYLYRARSHGGPFDPAARHDLMHLPERRAYNDLTLARAIREGLGPDGGQLDYLMPRFRIDDADMASLLAYLKHLSYQPSPGVGEATLQWATVITPDADPIKRRAMLDVLENFFGKENVFSGGKSPPAQLSRHFIPVAHRWQLHVWELTGPPETWGAELDERLRREPVFAVISGIGGATWEPVHRFCERAGVPCLFPNIDLPVSAEGDFYNVYFSKGVLLEAQLIAQRVRSSAGSGESPPAAGRRLVQVYRRGDIGEEAAAELDLALASSVAETADRVLDASGDARPLRAALSDIRADDVLVLWLRPAELRLLPASPPAGAALFVSGIMGGLERAPLPAAWRTVARLTYPFELPDRRHVAMDFALGWMRFKRVPVIDERTQTDTYLALVIAADTVKSMGADLVRDYLVETLEMHLGARLVNGYYPRLGLAPTQHFASKGGFLVHFADPQGERLRADGDWSVP